jgi:hypothetical protein
MGKSTVGAHRTKMKRNADNEFTTLTGIRAIQMEGGSNCLITKQNTLNNKPIRKVAYLLYNNITGVHPKRLRAMKVKTSCGVKNCVCRDHLIAHDPYKDTPPGLIF